MATWNSRGIRRTDQLRKPKVQRQRLSSYPEDSDTDNSCPL